MLAIILEKNGMIALETPFNRDFINDLKDEINYIERKWDGASKCWLVSQSQENKALEIASRYFEVVDGRGKSADEIEEVQIEGEIAQIKANQKAILGNMEYIEKTISDLEVQISRYSFRSKSSIKGAMCRDKALLEHSLRNAQLPVEQLVEMQIRGIVAALRLIEGGYRMPR